MADNNRLGSKPVSFTYPDGLKEAADYCFGSQMSDETHFKISGLTFDVDPEVGLSPAMIGFVRSIYFQ